MGSSDSPKGKVAIIGSPERVGETLTSYFKEAGFKVAAAETGEDGLVLCRQFLPQVVLIDVELSDTDGFQICRKLRATTRTSHAHIILLASTLDRDVRIQGLEMGADDFIIIPYDPDEVTLRVRNALRRAAANNLTDPVTGLSSGRMIQNQLRDLVGEEDGQWALLRLTVRNLRGFEMARGFLAAQEVLNLVALVLGETVEQFGDEEDFLGHSGGGRFVIVTSGKLVDSLSDELTTRIQDVIHTHHTPQEREQGFVVVSTDAGQDEQLPLMSLEIRRVVPSDGPFYDIRSLSEALG